MSTNASNYIKQSYEAAYQMSLNIDSLSDITTIKGTYNEALILSNTLEQEAIDQIQLLCNQEFVKDETIRIMPDCHAGAGCVIGYTQTLHNGYICPNLVGVDIACGMTWLNLGKVSIDLPKFQKVVKENIPTGFEVRDGKVVTFDRLKDLYCLREVGPDVIHFAHRSLGTLGGGNHFIELDEASNGDIYLVIHSGSRNLGKKVAEYYQALANKLVNHNIAEYYERRDNLIAQYKADGRKSEIQGALVELKKEYSKNFDKVPYDLAYLDGKYAEMYLHDMEIIHEYAHLNRLTIVQQILDHYYEQVYSWDDKDFHETFHNYIDFEDKILRKGAISAKKGELVLVPLNMRDGSLICIGKGNELYNYSGPHGAGRLMSRSQARETISLEDFKKSMEGIYSETVCEGTIDESPMAYKPMEEIIKNIEPVLEIVDRIKPIWNFKADDSTPYWRKDKLDK